MTQPAKIPYTTATAPASVAVNAPPYTPPKMMAGMMHDMFVLGSKPAEPLRKKIAARVKEVGFMNVLKDVYKGGKAI